MISKAEIVRLTDTAKALGHDVERVYEREGRDLVVTGVTINGTHYDVLSAGEKLRAMMPAKPAGQAVTLTWRKVTNWHRAPGYIWRLHAPAEVLAAIGGAPCHVGDMIGTLIRDGGLWEGRVELTPYQSAEVAGREVKARYRLESAVIHHLQSLGFGVVEFVTSDEGVAGQ